MRIAVFARAPVAGRVKTRLQPALGADGALDLHRQLIESTLFRARDAALGAVTLWIDGDPQSPEVGACVKRQRVGLQVQRGADLGARMHAAFTDETATDPQGCLLIGCDCPALTSTRLRAAAATLADHDVVLIPALDGGYVLIGLHQPQAALFDGIRWGGNDVLAATRKRIADAGLRCAELAPLPDLDTPDDYSAALAAGWISR
jgi:rSAM/selenodomain-associated transferase 1